MLGGLGVRRAMGRLHHRTAEQRQVVNEMRQRAEELTASGQALARAKHMSPQPLCFVEVAGEVDFQRSFFPDGMLSGVAIGVSDALDVRDFRTRYGTDSQLLQQMPHSEFPFVSWLRRHGAQFVGKLACRTPLTLGEASLIVPDSPAAVSVFQNACNYAISSALMGPAAMTSPLHYDVAAFKPTAQSFATFTDSHRLGIPSMSVGITAARLDDIFYLWEVFTSAIQPSVFEDERKESSTNGGSGRSSSNSSSSSINGKNAEQGNNNNSISSSGYVGGWSGDAWRLHRNDYIGLHGHASSGAEEELLGPHIELSVGYPADWIDELCQERLLSADEFRRRILRLASTRNAMQKNEVLEVIPLIIDVDLETVVKATQTIALYELSQTFDRLYSWTGPDGKRVPSPSAPAVGSMSQPGVLEELPEELVSAIYHGRALTYLDYHRALRTRDTVVRVIEEQFRDVDLIVAPILSEPYVNSSMRSIGILLPFSLGGNPMVSVQLEPDLPVALIGELGRDTGLFEDSTTFLQFVRGTSPRWWRRKFMR
ncbi:hypothetical protein DQ04_01951020 [Trypanosoma grayi]|uniref:hypothetical protein n=1 Tax=Trypanosoma grayi TaxID=71804 RepID=UPI0004F4B0AA|nr:hypothetical protein DQ04_01951020 [Trypanosoma grayi]KEG12147.1 hypothetical protein DQ04_01951020 [Trypanosoma grayi]